MKMVERELMETTPGDRGALDARDSAAHNARARTASEKGVAE